MKVIITDIKNFTPPAEGEYEVFTPDKPVKECIGCFGCWLRTPGRCIIRDGYDFIGRSLGECEELIIISECCYGSYSPYVKTVIDRALGYVHPNFELVNGQMHHKARYENEIVVSAYFYGDEVTTEEKVTADKLVRAEAVNFHANVKCVQFIDDIAELEAIAL